MLDLRGGRCSGGFGLFLFVVVILFGGGGRVGGFGRGGLGRGRGFCAAAGIARPATSIR